MALKPAVHVVGMYGIGDNMHQMAVIRELLKTYEVWLETCHVWIYKELLERGDLHLILRPTSLWMHVQNIEKERHLYERASDIPCNAKQMRIWYYKPDIDKTGSILATMHMVAGLPCDKPDFSLPIRDEWRTPRVQAIVQDARAYGKPLMLYRPIVLRKEWDGKLRNPDPDAYAQLYASVRDQFYTVSIASLRPNIEWIIGDEQPADLKIHDGSLEMWEMAALFSQADIVFCNAGFAPVMAQAVGVPSITVYGGRESFRTTQRAGAHLAPSLGIDPINPCDCHSHRHNCDKRINVQAGIDRIKEFIDKHVAIQVQQLSAAE